MKKVFALVVLLTIIFGCTVGCAENKTVTYTNEDFGCLFSSDDSNRIFSTLEEVDTYERDFDPASHSDIEVLIHSLICNALKARVERGSLMIMVNPSAIRFVQEDSGEPGFWFNHIRLNTVTAVGVTSMDTETFSLIAQQIFNDYTDGEFEKNAETTTLYQKNGLYMLNYTQELDCATRYIYCLGNADGGTCAILEGLVVKNEQGKVETDKDEHMQKVLWQIIDSYQFI